MISYNNSDVVQCLRQYEMFANSLNLVKNKEQRDMIVKQLTKLEEKIIALTNDIYEEEYYALANRECGLLDEEKNRVTMLIDLINQRLSYIEKRCNNHYALTGESIDVSTVLGSSELDELENRVRIIDKYSKNIKLEKELNEEVKSLTSKISLASEKIDINKSLNVELETTFKKVLSNAFEKLNLYDLLDQKEDIEYAYQETEESLTLAQLNLETAKTSPINILNDCQEMYDDISKDYSKYKDKVMTLKLMEVFNKEVDGYDELLNKRKEINDILKFIKNQELLDMIMDTISKQYSTIVMEGQDINTFNDLVLERDRKLEALREIDEENNSEEFQNVLKVLIENERKRQEKILEEQRKIEEEERQRRLEIERKKQEEILKRQRIIEEARKKEMEKRTKKMLEEQQNSVLQGKKKEKPVSFETIKDNSIETKQEEEIKNVPNIEEITNKYELNIEKTDVSEDEETIRNKENLERELFAEFNTEKVLPKEDNEDEMDVKVEIDLPISSKPQEVEEEQNNKFPDMSLDEYMKNFDEKKVNPIDNIFDEDAFPSIPM